MSSLRRPPKSAIGMALFLAMTLGTTGVLFSTIAGRSVGDVSTYTAVFSDATRLLPGDDVRIAGVRVGRVREVKLGRDYTARVTFAVRRSVALPASTKAVIRYRDLVGARYLGLTSSGSVQEPGLLRPGATIPLSRTTPALDLTVLLDGFQPLFSALEPAQVNALAGNLVRTLQGEGGTLASLLTTTASLTTTLADRDAVIGRVVNNLGAVLATVDDRDAQLRELVDQLARLASGLAGDRQAIGNTLEGITALSTATAGLLEQARPPLTRDITSLRTAAEEFAKSQGDLQNLMDTLPVKLNAFTRAGSYGAYLNFFVCDLGITVTLPGLPPVTGAALHNNEELCQK